MKGKPVRFYSRIAQKIIKFHYFYRLEIDIESQAAIADHLPLSKLTKNINELLI